MMGVYIYVAILVLLVIIFTIWCSKKLFGPVWKMQKAGEGDRTKFIIDVSDKGFDYYNKKILNWLRQYNFKKYNKKRKAYFLKWQGNGIVFNFGFNYYKKDNSIVIETFLFVLGKENPLTEKTYSFEKGDVNILNVTQLKNPVSKGDEVIVIGKQGKDEYIKFLKTILNISDDISEINNVTIKDVIDYSMANKQKANKKSNIKFVLGILGISLLITLVLYIPSIIKRLNQPKPSAKDQSTALKLIYEKHPDFKLLEKDTSVDISEDYKGNEHYVITYRFEGTMNTPVKTNDKVIIYMSNSDYNNYRCIDEECSWGVIIIQNKANGKTWDFDLK